MVYIPYDEFHKHWKKQKKELSDAEIRLKWFQFLGYYPTKLSEWQMLLGEYGRLLRFHWTNWTPYGRVRRPGRHRFEDALFGRKSKRMDLYQEG